MKGRRADIDNRIPVIRILKRAYKDNAFINLELKDEDDFVRAAVYGTVTYTYTIDFLIKHIAKRDPCSLDIDTLTILRFGVWQILFSDKVPSYAAVSTSVELAERSCPRSKSLVNAVLRRISDSDGALTDLSRYKSEVQVSLKSEIFGILKKSYGSKRALEIGKAMLMPSPLTVRCNLLKTDIAALRNDLSQEGFEPSEGRFMEEAVIIRKTGKVPLDKTIPFVKGEFMVQSESAMLASRIADPQKGDTILDCCSAPGGKATHMAELTGDAAFITASDINSGRLELIRQNIARLGIVSITTMQADAVTGLPDKEYDIVTADVPCSGLGLIGKKPDIRLSLDYETIMSIRDVQKKIFVSASKRVKKGGTLVYSTCTLNKSENESAVEEFLSENGDFYADDISGYLPSDIIMDEERAECARKGHITIFPDTDGSDGFFIARLKRRS